MSGIKTCPPISRDEVTEFEAKAGISLPLDYVEFITSIANGGFCRLMPLNEWDYRYEIRRPKIESCLKEPCIVTPMAINHADNWIDAQNVDRWEERLDNNEWDPLSGTICVAEIGCGWVYSLIVNGPYFGRVFAYGGGLLIPPRFVEQTSFADWMDSYLDFFLAGQHVRFLGAEP